MAFLDMTIILVLMVMIASIVYHYRSELKLLRNVLSLKLLAGALEEGMDGEKNDADSNFKCPRCGREMEKISSSDSIFLWKDQLSPLGSSFFYRDIFSYPNRQMKPFGLPTYRCKLCGILYFDEFGSMLP